MKKTLTIILLIILGLSIFISCTQPKNKEITKTCDYKSDDGNSYSMLIGKFDTPYSPKYKPFSEVDLSNIKGFIDAYSYSGSYGWTNYLTLLDESAKNDAMLVDTESQGEYSKSFNDNIGKVTSLEIPIVYTHWVELNINQKTYSVIVGKFEKEEDIKEYEGVVPFVSTVKQDNKWLLTLDLLFYPLESEITEKSYDSLLRDCS